MRRPHPRPRTSLPWAVAVGIIVVPITVASRYCLLNAPRARLDFFATNHAGGATLLFFHGGYWQRNAKEGFNFWFAEADEGSDDAPCRLSIGPNGLPNRGWVEQCAPIGHG